MDNQEVLRYEQIISSVERAADITLKPYRYKGLGVHNSECTIEIWRGKNKAVVLFTDNNKGTSVTNAADQLITEIYNKHLIYLHKENCIFMETYDRKEGIDFIIPTWSGNKVESVSWVHYGNAQ
jgi:hypothetical protein